MTATGELLAALSTAGWPSRLLTLADWDALPHDEICTVEISEGVLQIVPNAHPRHQGATARLLSSLASACPDSVRVLPECDVLLSLDPLTVRGPDVLVVTAEAFGRGDQRFRADDLLLAVEVVSPGSGTTDRVTKLSEYERAGIPAYWVVDLDDGVSLTELVLSGGRYELVREHRTATELIVAGTPVDIDLDGLVR